MNELTPSPIPTSATAAAAAAASQRLDRLEYFLRQDTANELLLIDAFETALACGAWDRAQFHLAHGQSLGTSALAWRLREGDYWLAQQRYDEARGVLETLAKTSPTPPGFAEVLLHNLAFIDLKQGRYRECIAQLGPALEPPRGMATADPVAATAKDALQAVWLRALHHDGQLTRALEWVRAAEAQQMLGRHAAGVASLVALDASDFASAQRWSAASLSQAVAAQASTEALVTQASLALAGRDAAQARQLADAALQRQPDDGRAWSARGFAGLLAGDFADAASAFRRALAGMPGHIGTWHGQAWTQLLQGDLPAAAASFRAALDLDRNFAESHGGLAVVLAIQKLQQEAQTHVQLALRLDPHNVSGRYAQALLNGEVRDARDLQRLARRLLGGRGAPLGGDMADMIPAPADDSAEARSG